MDEPRKMIDKAIVIEIRGDKSFTPTHRDICNGTFPEPVQVGNKSKWFLDEVLQWQQNLVRKKYKAPPPADAERLDHLPRRKKHRKQRLVRAKLANRDGCE